MPGVSQDQVVAMRIAKHHPEKIYARNKGLAKMSDSQLEDYVHTPTGDLPKHVPHPVYKRKAQAE